MLNSKLEKILIFFVWYVLLVVFRFVLPITEPPGNIDKYVVVFLSALVTVIIYRVYVYYRNKQILKKINLLIETNEFDEAIKFIKKCLSRQKKCLLVCAYNLYVLAMCGRITEFENKILEYGKSNKLKKIVKLDFVQGLVYIINYFKTYTISNVSVNQRYWVEITNILSEKETAKNIPVLLNAYSSATFGIIKSVYAFKLYFTYLRMENIEKAELYYEKALEFAPSLEIAFYIENCRNIEQ